MFEVNGSMPEEFDETSELEQEMEEDGRELTSFFECNSAGCGCYCPDCDNDGDCMMCDNRGNDFYCARCIHNEDL